MDRVELKFASSGGWAVLRELRGCDEETVEGVGTGDAIQLLDHILVAAAGAAIAPGQAANLIAAHRDQLLAAMYRRSFGERVASTVACRACREPFDLDFGLSALEQSLREQGRAANIEAEGEGRFKLADGRRFRLPTGADELAVSNLDATSGQRELLHRCLIKSSADGDPEVVMAAMEAVAPLLDLDLDARCPSCGSAQTVHFDLQLFVLRSILEERQLRVAEFHRIAIAYGWSLTEILSLPRSQRRAFCAQINGERPPP